MLFFQVCLHFSSHFSSFRVKILSSTSASGPYYHAPNELDILRQRHSLCDLDLPKPLLLLLDLMCSCSEARALSLTPYFLLLRTLLLRETNWYQCAHEPVTTFLCQITQLQSRCRVGGKFFPQRALLTGKRGFRGQQYHKRNPESLGQSSDSVAMSLKYFSIDNFTTE